MEFNEYATQALIKQRHDEMIAAAHSEAVARAVRPRRRSVRAAVGTALIRLGAWLLRGSYEGASVRT